MTSVGDFNRRGLENVQSSSMAFSGDLLEPVLGQAGVAQPARLSKVGDEAVEYLIRRLAWMAHRRRDIALTVAVDRCVVRQHIGQHYTRRMTMRYVGGTAENMTDGMTGAKLDAGDDAAHGEPRAEQALRRRRQIRRVTLCRRQAFGQQF